MCYYSALIISKNKLYKEIETPLVADKEIGSYCDKSLGKISLTFGTILVITNVEVDYYFQAKYTVDKINCAVIHLLK